MFFSAEDRKKSETPIQIIHSSSVQPKGLAPSPFIVSLWEGEKIPTFQNIKKNVIQSKTEKENNISPLSFDEDEELQTIENLFRGNGRIEYNATSQKRNDENFVQQYEEQNKKREDEQLYSKNIAPKKIRIPSREEQLQKMKNSKKDYSIIFNKPSQKNNSFFRNFAFWK